MIAESPLEGKEHHLHLLFLIKLIRIYDLITWFDKRNISRFIANQLFWFRNYVWGIKCRDNYIHKFQFNVDEMKNCLYKKKLDSYLERKMNQTKINVEINEVTYQPPCLEQSLLQVDSPYIETTLNSFDDIVENFNFE